MSDMGSIVATRPSLEALDGDQYGIRFGSRLSGDAADAFGDELLREADDLGYVVSVHVDTVDGIDTMTDILIVVSREALDQPGATLRNRIEIAGRAAQRAADDQAAHLDRLRATWLRDFTDFEL